MNAALPCCFGESRCSSKLRKDAAGPVSGPRALQCCFPAGQPSSSSSFSSCPPLLRGVVAPSDRPPVCLETASGHRQEGKEKGTQCSLLQAGQQPARMPWLSRRCSLPWAEWQRPDTQLGHMAVGVCTKL